MVSFTAVWKDTGLLKSQPPFLVVPWEALGLVYLNGTRSFDIGRDLRFDPAKLRVRVVRPNEVQKHLLKYSQCFPAKVFADVLALWLGIETSLRFGSVLLAVEGKLAGHTASLDYVGKAGQAKMDVFTAKRRSVDVAFRFVRYPDATGKLNRGTVHTPSYAAELLDVMNRLYLPVANIELSLASAQYVNIPRALGDEVLKSAFLTYVAPQRDPLADVTVFFLGPYKGSTDPLGEAFKDLDCVVVDDAPLQYIAPPTTWPRPTISDEEITYAGRPLDRPRSDRDLHIVLAHEIAHCLGAGHNSEPDNLMSMGRQDFRFSRDTIRAIGGK